MSVQAVAHSTPTPPPVLKHAEAPAKTATPAKTENHAAATPTRGSKVDITA